MTTSCEYMGEEPVGGPDMPWSSSRKYQAALQLMSLAARTPVKFRSNPSSMELLTILLGKKEATKLAKYNLGSLAMASYIEIVEDYGLSPKAASTLRSAFDMAILAAQEQRIKPGIQLKDSRVVYEIMRERIALLPEEQVWLLLVNKNLELIKEIHLSTGAQDQAMVDIRSILNKVLHRRVPGFIICHNHPSGNSDPGVTDRSLTEKLTSASETMGVKFHDHVIIVRGGFFSMYENGLMK